MSMNAPPSSDFNGNTGKMGRKRTGYAIILLVMKMIYQRLRNLHEDSDLTQRELAERLYVSQKTYSKYELGQAALPVETLMMLADYYGTSIDYLLNRTDEKKPYPGAKKRK